MRVLRLIQSLYSSNLKIISIDIALEDILRVIVKEVGISSLNFQRIKPPISPSMQHLEERQYIKKEGKREQIKN